MVTLSGSIGGVSGVTMTDISGTTETQLEKPKKGRRPKTKPYFGQVQEDAVRVFLTATTWDEKNTVYNMCILCTSAYIRKCECTNV